MPILITNEELDLAIDEHANRFPIKTNRRSLCEAILRRAVREDTDWLARWISEADVAVEQPDADLPPAVASSVTNEGDSVRPDSA